MSDPEYRTYGMNIVVGVMSLEPVCWPWREGQVDNASDIVMEGDFFRPKGPNRPPSDGSCIRSIAVSRDDENSMLMCGDPHLTKPHKRFHGNVTHKDLLPEDYPEVAGKECEVKDVESSLPLR
nr:hypothetical protein Iba_chr10cCG11030 [Ipomoea batatas]